MTTSGTMAIPRLSVRNDKRGTTSVYQLPVPQVRIRIHLVLADRDALVAVRQEAVLDRRRFREPSPEIPEPARLHPDHRRALLLENRPGLRERRRSERRQRRRRRVVERSLLVDQRH